MEIIEIVAIAPANKAAYVPIPGVFQRYSVHYVARWPSG